MIPLVSIEFGMCFFRFICIESYIYSNTGSFCTTHSRLMRLCRKKTAMYGRKQRPKDRLFHQTGKCLSNKDLRTCLIVRLGEL